MASFKSIISRIFHGIQTVEEVAEPVIKTLLPASIPIFALIDPFIGKIQSTIVTVEANSPDGTPGKDKFNAVLGDFKAGLELANAALALGGEQLVFDEASFTAAVNAQVEALRQFSVLKASVHKVALAAPAA